MRLESITLPFLEADMTIKSFSNTVGLTSTRVSQIILRDLSEIHYILYKLSDFEMRYVPLKREVKNIWIHRIKEYNQRQEVTEKIIEDNRKICELTVSEFISLMSYLK